LAQQGNAATCDEQSELFDDVFCHLIKKIERNALIELSGS